MCKLLVTINQSENTKELEKLIKVQLPALDDEPDGASGFVLLKTGEVHTYRSLHNYKDVFNKTLNHVQEASIVALHTRTGTTGSKSEDNVHFFNIGGRFLAHNGFVGKFHTSKYWTRTNYASNSKIDTPVKPYHERNMEALGVDKRRMGFSNVGSDAMDAVDRAGTGEVSTYEIEATIANCGGCFSSKKGYCKRHKHLASQIDWSGYNGNNEPSDKDSEDTTLELQTSKAITKPVDEDCNDTTDSYQFLQTLPAHASVEQIKKHIDDTQFTGIAFLYDNNIGKAFLLVKKTAYCIADKKKYTGFFSYDPETELTKDKVSFASGVPYISGEEKISLSGEAKELVQGVYEIDIPSHNEKVET